MAMFPVEPAKELEMFPLTMIPPVPSRVRVREDAALLLMLTPPLKEIDPFVALIVESALGVMLPLQLAALALVLKTTPLEDTPALLMVNASAPMV
jgi:hypothetical protein